MSQLHTLGDEVKDEPPAYAVVKCRGDSVPGYSCGSVDLTQEQYVAQMMKPDHVWCCPNCGSTAIFDDAAFERIHGVE